MTKGNGLKRKRETVNNMKSRCYPPLVIPSLSLFQLIGDDDDWGGSRVREGGREEDMARIKN